MPLPSSSEAVRSIGLAIPMHTGKLVCALAMLSCGSCTRILLLRRLLTPGVTANTLLYLSVQGGVLLAENRAIKQENIAPWPLSSVMYSSKRSGVVCWAVNEESEHGAHVIVT